MASTSTRCGGYFLEPFLTENIRKCQCTGDHEIFHICACNFKHVTSRLSEVSAYSLGQVDGAFWTAETSAREAGDYYLEERGQCKATAAPNPSLHCTCTYIYMRSALCPSQGLYQKLAKERNVNV